MKKELKTYQQMQSELDKLMASLRQGSGDIDESVIQYQQAMQLIKELEEYLKNAQNKISKIKKDFSG